MIDFGHLSHNLLLSVSILSKFLIAYLLFREYFHGHQATCAEFLHEENFTK